MLSTRERDKPRCPLIVERFGEVYHLSHPGMQDQCTCELTYIQWLIRGLALVGLGGAAVEGTNTYDAGGDEGNQSKELESFHHRKYLQDVQSSHDGVSTREKAAKMAFNVNPMDLFAPTISPVTLQNLKTGLSTFQKFLPNATMQHYDNSEKQLVRGNLTNSMMNTLREQIGNPIKDLLNHTTLKQNTDQQMSQLFYQLSAQGWIPVVYLLDPKLNIQVQNKLQEIQTRLSKANITLGNYPVDANLFFEDRAMIDTCYEICRDAFVRFNTVSLTDEFITDSCKGAFTDIIKNSQDYKQYYNIENSREDFMDYHKQKILNNADLIIYEFEENWQFAVKTKLAIGLIGVFTERESDFFQGSIGDQAIKMEQFKPQRNDYFDTEKNNLFSIIQQQRADPTLDKNDLLDKYLDVTNFFRSKDKLFQQVLPLIMLMEPMLMKSLQQQEQYRYAASRRAIHLSAAEDARQDEEKKKKDNERKLTTRIKKWFTTFGRNIGTTIYDTGTSITSLPGVIAQKMNQTITLMLLGGMGTIVGGTAVAELLKNGKNSATLNLIYSLIHLCTSCQVRVFRQGQYITNEGFNTMRNPSEDLGETEVDPYEGSDTMRNPSEDLGETEVYPYDGSDTTSDQDQVYLKLGQGVYTIKGNNEHFWVSPDDDNLYKLKKKRGLSPSQILKLAKLLKQSEIVFVDNYNQNGPVSIRGKISKADVTETKIGEISSLYPVKVTLRP